MESLDIKNPFGGPVYHFDSCTSTMDEARRFNREVPNGTVVMAAMQTRGRGRFPGRAWAASAGKNLTFTLILRYDGFSSVPVAITLRSGIAVARAIEALEPVLAARLAVKWPNDVMLGNKKCAGLIAESDGNTVLLGIGVNVAEDFGGTSGSAGTKMPGAASIAGELAALDKAAALVYAEAPHRVPILLEKTLSSLFDTLSSGFDDAWRGELENRLYLKGQTVSFVTGAADAPRTVAGTLAGINQSGALLLIPVGKTEAEAFAAGEITSATGG